MDVRVITLRYQEGLQGFPEEALRKAISGREVLEAREHFFVHGNTPHMAPRRHWRSRGGPSTGT